MTTMETTMQIGLAILGNDQVFNLIATLAVGFVTYLGNKVGRGILEQQDIDRSRDALLAAAHDLYPLVAVFKSQNNGKLTEKQVSDLQDRAMARAIEIGKSTGVDIMKVLGPTLAKAFLEQSVKSLKSRAPQMILPPEVVANMAPATTAYDNIKIPFTGEEEK